MQKQKERSHLLSEENTLYPSFFSIESIIPVSCVHCIYIYDTPRIKSGQFVVRNKVFFF
jgi:hypothetical protein